MIMAKHNRRGYKKIYDKFADNYDHLYGRILTASHKKAIRAMQIKPKMTILEVGMGTGLTLKHYPKNVHILGIDISEAMLEQAALKIHKLKLKNVHVEAMSAEKMNLESNSFDRVFAPSVISAVGNPKKVINEMIRVCEKDGLICIVSHFAGKSFFSRCFDYLWNPLTKYILGYSMHTDSALIEDNPKVEVLQKKSVIPLFPNFSTLYLLRKK